VARRFYDTIDLDLAYPTEYLFLEKQEASDKRRNPLARPDISDAEVREFLKNDLGDGNLDLHPVEIAAFDFIKETANTDMNIQEVHN
jgi:hypothetical protein